MHLLSTMSVLFQIGMDLLQSSMNDVDVVFHVLWFTVNGL